jgi:RimJ/RimL family protein N-acetyltransferase
VRIPRFHKLGGHSDGDTPLIIPNREVKPVSADGTRGAIPRESRTPPISFTTSPAEGLVVVLRAWRPSDAPAVARACDDPESARFLAGFPSPYTLADAEAYLDRVRTWPERGDFAYAIVDVADELLGSITLHLGAAPPAIGYWVAPWARGRGVATAALRALATWAVDAGGLDRLELTTDPENVASQRVAEKAGFIREGIVAGYLETAVGPRDSIVFSLRRP